MSSEKDYQEYISDLKAKVVAIRLTDFQRLINNAIAAHKAGWTELSPSLFGDNTEVMGVPPGSDAGLKTTFRRVP